MGHVSRAGGLAGRILVFLFCLVQLRSLEAQLEPPRAVPNELIVLLPPASDPVAVVAAINQPSPSQPIPHGLGTANPVSAELLIEPRPTGNTLQWMLNHPHRPLSRLHRYILLRYPSGTDTTNVRATLEGIGEVEHVEPNYTFELHSALVPNDPLLGQPGEGVTVSQWGTHVLRLPEAWEWSKGHTPIGFLDTGVDREHEDLKTWRTEGTPPRLVLNGGNVREHLSYNFKRRICDISETTTNSSQAGHGSHTSGIAAAATANSVGVSGACWHCPVQMQLVFTNDGIPTSEQVSELDSTDSALVQLSSQGAPIVNLSGGLSGYFSCDEGRLDAFCTALTLVAERDQVFVASAGNIKYPVDFPANDPQVVAVGGVERDTSSPLGFARWDDCAAGGYQCGSNHGIEMDVVAPAKEVLSTVFAELDHLADCGDSSAGTADDGYGLCTGTSMSAPYVAGVVGLIRSVQPLLNREQVRDVLISSGSHKDNFTNQLGYGVPYADVAVKKALGSVGGQTLNNRLTPLFSLYSVAAEVHVLTPWPSEALAFVFDPIEPFGGAGQSVPGYLAFPGYEVCTISPCPDATPRSTFSVFTTHRQIPGMPALVPLYRVRFDYGHYWRCEGGSGPMPGRSFAYTTTAEGVEYFKTRATAPVPGAPPPGTQIGYELDGILGYIFPRCSPEPSCMPPGTTRLRRFYHPQRDDYVLFPDEQLAYWQSLGYVETTTLSTVLGYVYANTDTDYDGLIDGFEDLVGTKKNVADTDCDGISDGAEVGTYDMTLHGYRDPLAGPCTYLFADGFETGNTARWSLTSFLDDGIEF